MTEERPPLRRDLRVNADAAPGPSPSEDPVLPAAADLSGDLVHPEVSARIPGDTRRPLTRFPTDQIEVQSFVETGPELDAPIVGGEFAPGPLVKGTFAPWALALSILALAASFFVGWGIPIALLAVGFAFAALRRPIESRALAGWALVLGLLATVYSLGWLIWAAMALERLS